MIETKKCSIIKMLLEENLSVVVMVRNDYEIGVVYHSNKNPLSSSELNLLRLLETGKPGDINARNRAFEILVNIIMHKRVDCEITAEARSITGDETFKPSHFCNWEIIRQKRILNEISKKEQLRLILQ